MVEILDTKKRSNSPLRAGFVVPVCLLLALPLIAATVGKALVPKPHYKEIAQQFARQFPYRHLRQVPLNDRISAQAWTNYLAVLDYERVYFLQSDIDKLAGYRFLIDDQLRAGRMDMAFDAFEIYRQRVGERFDFVTNQLSRGFNFDLNESYLWRRKDAEWPADEDAQNNLWRRRLKHEMLRLTVGSIVATNNASTNGLTLVTNQVAGVVTVSTNLLASGTNTLAAADATATNSPAADPEGAILKRYEQFNIILQDSDAEWVLQRFLTAVASAFDPHSSYMSPATLEDFQIDMKLSLVGIGALLNSEDGAAKIVSLIPGGPASRDKRPAALKPGDKIIGVGQGDGPIEDVLHWPLYKTVRLIRGEKGTKVMLQVIDGNDPAGLKTRLVDLIRDEVKLEEQAASSEIREIKLNEQEFKLGVVELPTFYASMGRGRRGSEGYRSAADDVAELLKQFATNGVEGVILDLRGNGGGSLREAIRLAGVFFREGPVVQVREPRQIHRLDDDQPGVVWRKPAVVLIDRLSASASEIVAGALQDYGRAVIVGDSRTHGKGSVQTISEMGDDSKLGSLKVTTASFYRISGGSTQLKGVEPDILVPSLYDGMELGEDHLPNAMPWTQVAPLSYQKVAELDDVIVELKARSERRLAKDVEFEKHRRLIERVRKVNAAERISVNRDKRVREAMDEDVESLLPGEQNGDGKEEDGKQQDPVLDEALRILADLVVVQGDIPSLDESADSPADLSELLFRKVFGL